MGTWSQATASQGGLHRQLAGATLDPSGVIRISRARVATVATGGGLATMTSSGYPTTRGDPDEPFRRTTIRALSTTTAIPKGLCQQPEPVFSGSDSEGTAETRAGRLAEGLETRPVGP
jgi:hypothetical protein